MMGIQQKYLRYFFKKKEKNRIYAKKLKHLINVSTIFTCVKEVISMAKKCNRNNNANPKNPSSTENKTENK